MNTRTYDRNVTKGLALIADEAFVKVRYVHIAMASAVIEDVSFKTLRGLHQAAYGKIGEANPDFDPPQWVRYSEHLALNLKYKVYA